MIVTKENYLEQVAQIPDDGLRIFDDVSWEEYEEFIEELGENYAYRVCYDDGRMQVMPLSPEHERYNMLMHDLIVAMCDTLELELEPFGSTTMRRKRKRKGVEPDKSYYLKNAPHLLAAESGGERIDVNYDPPPDLVLEVDITHGSLNKFPIYAGLGVPEIWRYDGRRVEFYRLAGDSYLQIHTSDAFPFLTPEVLTQFLKLGEAEGHPKARRAMREWATANKPE